MYTTNDAYSALSLVHRLNFSAVVEDRFPCRHVGSNFIPTATKQWSGNKCSDVPTKIQTTSYAMDHRDWPGKQWWAEHQACPA